MLLPAKSAGAHQLHDAASLGDLQVFEDIGGDQTFRYSLAHIPFREYQTIRPGLL